MSGYIKQMITRDRLDEQTLRGYLEKLESIINTDHVERTKTLQRRAFNFEPVEHIPTVIGYPVPEDEWPDYGFLEIFEDPARMLLQELKSVYSGAKLQDDRLYGIRPNYGTGIIASMFGCETKTFDHALPIGLHVSKERLEQILEQGVPDLNAGVFGKVLDTAAYFRETLKPYPKLSKTVGIQLFDIQGTFDNASIIWGSDIYLAFYDAPDKVKGLIEIARATISVAVKEFRRVAGGQLDENDGCWNFLGGICLRDDSCINISGEQYLEFVKPFNVRLLNEFGGWIHFCGKAHQWWQELLDIQSLRGINPYQGEFYNLIEMYKKCETAKIPIVQWTMPLNNSCRERIRTGFSQRMEVSSFDDACRSKDALYATGHADKN